MKQKEMAVLSPGDVIKHAGGGEPYIVMANYGNRVTAARTVDVTNPGEWKVVSRSINLKTLGDFVEKSRGG